MVLSGVRKNILFMIILLVFLALAVSCGGGSGGGSDPEDNAGISDPPNTNPGGSGVTGLVPDTGQNDCFDSDGNIINPPVAGKAYFGQDAQYLMNKQSFTKLDSTGKDLSDSASSWAMVRDNITGLIWEVKTDDGSVHDKERTYNPPIPGEEVLEDSVESFILKLNSQKFGGYSDWRIPTIKELIYLADYGRSFPAINTDFFPNTHTSHTYLSSSIVPDGGSVDAYLHLHFDHGTTWNLNFRGAIRAVRGKSYSGGNFIDNGNGTATDQDSGLMWKKTLLTWDTGGNTGNNFSWDNALAACENLNFAGYADWRLPNVKELATIVDCSRSNPPLYGMFVDPSTSITYILSSTTSTRYSSQACSLRTIYGELLTVFSKDDPFGTVFCVRAVKTKK